jgi:drug/metabolite transporter (DMT)-like permease
MAEHRTRQAYTAGLGAVVLWSTVASAFKLALARLSVVQLLLVASVSSTLCLFLVLVFQGRLALLRSQTPKQWLVSAFAGFLNPFVYYLILFAAYDLLPAQEAQPLNYTWPLALALLSVPLLGQRLRAAALLGSLVSLLGVVVISTHGRIGGLQFTSLRGTVLALTSAVVWALYWILNLRDRRDPVLRLFTGFLVGTVLVLVLALARGEVRGLPVRGLPYAVYVGLFEMGITFVLWQRALQLGCDNARISGLAYLSPFLSLLFIATVIGERIRLSSVAGLCLIVAGILIQARRVPRSQTPPRTGDHRSSTTTSVPEVLM